MKLFVFASFRPPVHPYVRVENNTIYTRPIGLHLCATDLKIFCLYSEKKRVMTGLCICTLDKHLCFSHTLELMDIGRRDIYFFKIPYRTLIYKFVNLVVCTSCPETINAFIY